MFDETAIQKIADMSKDGSHHVSPEGLEYVYSSRNGLQLTIEPLPDSVYVKSLSSLVDFYKTTFIPNVMFHVVSPTTVNLIDIATSKTKARATHAYADISEDVRDNFDFATDLQLERFIVSVQTAFMQTEARDALINAVSHVSVEEGADLIDDGVSQQASSKKGVHLKTLIKLANPVYLKLHKTFGEIEDVQKEEPYVFRVAKSRHSACAVFKLYENESLAWRTMCMEQIKDYLKFNSEIPVI